VIHRLAIPNPFFEGRNSVYLLKLDPITIIDTGVATDKAFEHLEAGLHEHGIQVSDIRRIILTHKHIDHIGNAWRIQEASGADIFIHECEQKSITDVDPTGDRFLSLVRRRLEDWGVPAAESPANSESKMPLWKLQSATVSPLVDGQQLPTAGDPIQVIHTPGHTMGSICLQMGDQLFSGDHVLRDISPNIGGGDMRSSGMLGRFMSSLDRVRNLQPADVLPGHGEPFTGLAARCDTLLAHHEQRLQATLSALQDGATTVYQVATALFGELNDFHIVLGCAEANAHLELLIERGVIAEDFSLAT